MRRKQDIRERIGTPIASVLAIVLFILALFVVLWAAIIAVRLLVG